MKNQIKQILKPVLFAAAIAPLTGAEEGRAIHTQTQQGVSVTIEKVALERIVNEPAWVEAAVAGEKDSELKESMRKTYRKALPLKQFTCFISVVGDTKVYGPIKMDFVEDQGPYIGSGAAFFSPPKWQPQVPNLVVDPKAGGIKAWLTLDAKVPLAKIFPIRIEVKVTSADGEVLTFEFEKVEF